MKSLLLSSAYIHYVPRSQGKCNVRYKQALRVVLWGNTSFVPRGVLHSLNIGFNQSY